MSNIADSIAELLRLLAERPTIPLITRQPWDVLGISRAAYFRLDGTPDPVDLPGFSHHVWRISDLTKWIDKLPKNRRPGRRPVRKAKPVEENGSQAEECVAAVSPCESPADHQQAG